MFRRNLTIQGFACNSENFDLIEPWLRLNPAICLALVVVGFTFSSPKIFLIIAAFALIGAMFPHALGDIVYNTAIRRLTKTPPLLPNPTPRRFACFIGFLWTLAIAWMLYAHYVLLASIFSVILILVIIPMVAVHFCVASEIYQKIIGYKPKKDM